LDAVHDFVSGFGPDKGLWAGVIEFEVIAKGILQLTG
jgi:hypothetical protein